MIWAHLLQHIRVQLDCDNRTMVQPYVIIGCDTDIIIDRCVFGAPDFVLESETYPVIYGFEQPIPVGIYDGKLKIDMKLIWEP